MYIIVFVTTGNREESEKIARTLVSEGLAACVNIVENIKSIYKWNGKIEESEENLLIIKTLKEKFEKLSSKIKEEHSYDNPEIISFEISQGSEEYLKWVKESMSGSLS